jgi:hypothetical protein
VIENPHVDQAQSFLQTIRDEFVRLRQLFGTECLVLRHCMDLARYQSKEGRRKPARRGRAKSRPVLDRPWSPGWVVLNCPIYGEFAQVETKEASRSHTCDTDVATGEARKADRSHASGPPVSSEGRTPELLDQTKNTLAVVRAATAR